MKSRLLSTVLLIVLVCLTPLTVAAQEKAMAAAVVAASNVVPNLVNYTGVLKDATGRTRTAVTGVTFLLYSSEQGGAPLWLETQNVTPDKTGHYTVQLGSSTANGLPSDLFVNGEARWLAVQISSETEQPRVLLVAVPYAMKAVDAQTLGGLPASAFVLAAPPTSSSATASTTTGAAGVGSSSAAPLTTSNVTTTGGTSGRIPMFTTATNIQNSILTQTSTTAINVLGKLNLPALGKATSTTAFSSRPQTFVASVFNSGTASPVAQTFQWQAEPVNNDKTTASGTLNLLYGSGTATPAETGLKISSKGILTFALGQTFPGTGTITKVIAGSDLTGGGSSGTVTLNLDITKVPQLNTANTFTGNQKVNGTMTATSLSGNGAALTNVNAVRLGGLAAGAFAQLAAPNTFTKNQTIIGTGGGLALVVVQPAAATGSGLAGANAFEAVGSDADPNSTKVGGIGIIAEGGTGGTANISGAGGNAINAAGGSAGNGNGGVGVQAGGGFGIGGDSVSTGSGGAGVVATGGDSELFFGGDGIDAKGGAGGTGNNFASTSGNGVVGTGGPGGFQEADGTGGFFTGGNASFGGFGIEVFAGSDIAAFFKGDITVTGAISAGTKDFKIDHPLDPANKYLYHASVESSEMINVYTGNVTTDAQGAAEVQLPDWFEAVNTDFRYQLTVIGQFAQAIVSRRVSNNQFAIKTDKPNVDVSWQIIGVRQDAYAKAHPLVVEERKNAHERGFYLHPELYGAPEEKGVAWSHHPGTMRRVKALQQHKKSVPTPRSSRQTFRAAGPH